MGYVSKNVLRTMGDYCLSFRLLTSPFFPTRRPIMQKVHCRALLWRSYKSNHKHCSPSVAYGPQLLQALFHSRYKPFYFIIHSRYFFLSLKLLISCWERSQINSTKCRMLLNTSAILRDFHPLWFYGIPSISYCSDITVI